MRSEIKRWTDSGVGLRPHETGAYVRYDDHIAEVGRLRDQIAAMAQSAADVADQMEPTHLLLMETIIKLREAEQQIIPVADRVRALDLAIPSSPARRAHTGHTAEGSSGCPRCADIAEACRLLRLEDTP